MLAPVVPAGPHTLTRNVLEVAESKTTIPGTVLPDAGPPPVAITSDGVLPSPWEMLA